jgi:hypothetical protein
VTVSQLGLLFTVDEFQLNPSLLTLAQADVCPSTAPARLTPDFGRYLHRAQRRSREGGRVGVSQLIAPVSAPRLGFNHTGGDGPKTQVCAAAAASSPAAFRWFGLATRPPTPPFDNFYTFQINSTGRDFRFPQVHQPGRGQVSHGGFVATIEALFTEGRERGGSPELTRDAHPVSMAGRGRPQPYPISTTGNGPRVNSFNGPRTATSYLPRRGRHRPRTTPASIPILPHGPAQERLRQWFYATAVGYTFPRPKTSPPTPAAMLFQRLPVVATPTATARLHDFAGLQHHCCRWSPLRLWRENGQLR